MTPRASASRRARGSLAMACSATRGGASAQRGASARFTSTSPMPSAKGCAEGKDGHSAACYGTLAKTLRMTSAQRADGRTSGHQRRSPQQGPGADQLYPARTACQFGGHPRDGRGIWVTAPPDGEFQQQPPVRRHPQRPCCARGSELLRTWRQPPGRQRSMMQGVADGYFIAPSGLVTRVACNGAGGQPYAG